MPGAVVLFARELTFSLGKGMIRCREEFATEPFKLLGVERGQDVAQVIVGRRAILERAKAAKQPKRFDPE